MKRRSAAALLAALLLGCASAAVPAAEPAAPDERSVHLEFVREYIRELGEQERLLQRVEFVTSQPGASHMTEMIGYGMRVQIAMRSYIGQLNRMRLTPPHDGLIPNLVGLHTTKYRVHGRIVQISTAMLTGPKEGADLTALAAEMPQLRNLLDEVDAVLVDTSELVFTTLVATAQREEKPARLLITAAERQELLALLESEFGDSLEFAHDRPLVSAAALLRSHLQQEFIPADG